MRLCFREPLLNEIGTIDVGALSEEFFALAIDPYPRGSGVSVEAAADDAQIDAVEGQLQRKLRSLIQKS